MMPEARPGGSAPAGGVLHVGTWNMSHWSAPKVTVVASRIPVDILAV